MVPRLKPNRNKPKQPSAESYENKMVTFKKGYLLKKESKIWENGSDGRTLAAELELVVDSERKEQSGQRVEEHFKHPQPVERFVLQFEKVHECPEMRSRKKTKTNKRLECRVDKE